MQEITDFDVIAIGKRACDRFAQAFVSSEKFSSEDAWKLSKELCEDYKANKFNKLVVVSTKYESAMSQVPQVTQLMPIEASNNANLTPIFEPNEKIILEKLVLIWQSLTFHELFLALIVYFFIIVCLFS